MRGAVKVTGILLYAKPPWRIEDKETGEVNAGMTITYLPDESMEHLEELDKRGNIIKGIKPVEENIPHECHEKLVSVPGMYTFYLKHMDVKVDREYNGKTTQKVIQRTVPVDLDYIGAINVTVNKPSAKQ